MDMDRIQPEQQIWQRVLGQPEAEPGEELRELMRSCGESAALYRQLAGALSGRQREMAKQLQEEETAALETLKGVGRLMGRESEGLKLWQPEKMPGAKLLEKAYHRTLRFRRACLARSAEPELGEVFRYLADQAALRCARIARLLGSLG